jgi:hypothetical protein
MRWTDLPPERGPADAGGSALSRGEWEDLRRRLEQLPPGHPSRPDAEGAERADEGAERADEGSRPPGQPGPDPDDGREADRDDGRGRQRGTSGDARHAGHGELASPGKREPYRPWFTAGESPEPWFAPDPD